MLFRSTITAGSPVRLFDGNPVVLSGSSLPTAGLLANVAYTVTNATATTFKLLSNGVPVVVTADVGDFLFVQPAVVWTSTDTADKTFTVPIIDDQNIDPNGYFNVTLTLETASDTIADIVGPNPAKVNIIDNDASGGGIDISYSNGVGVDNAVLSSTVQTNGQVIIGGQFTTFNGTSRNRIARLNADGSLDATFLNGLAGADATVNSVFLDNNQNPLQTTNVNKVLIGGAFGNVNGTARNRVARLLSTGVLDASFVPPALSGAAIVYAVAVQADDSVIVAGNFNVGARQHIIRLLNNGTLDTTFLVSGAVGPNAEVRTVLLQSDGKLVIGGDFTSVNGVNINRIARLNSDGSLDTTFDPQAGASAVVRVVVADGPADGTSKIGRAHV